MSARKKGHIVTCSLALILSSVRSTNLLSLNMDLDNVKSELVTREFIAVVLAGFGNEYVFFFEYIVANHFHQTCSSHKQLRR